ncbi:hypothetical protein GCM10011380_03270 [Sphingomonas metalli]|uniref:Lipoprotein n=1 Tax=Sphingomonas metalli TaxID=1779358 RepID=A0A916WMS3_9SPHN|nr:hypothetical protein GCM10011380_03270 [Sphingomonas metalli]
MRITLFLLPLGLAACATQPVPRVPQNSAPPAPSFSAAGLERVMGQHASTLTRLLGEPDADVREGPARKLQFASNICVLDAYLYPGKDGAEPRVTYIDTREPDGSAIDRASCLSALTRRDGGR